MTALESTVFRIVHIGGKRFALGLHPGIKEDSISIREISRRTAYVVPVSAVRIQAALAFGRAELAAKREARKFGVPWKQAKRRFLANIMPPKISHRRKAANDHLKP